MKFSRLRPRLFKGSFLANTRGASFVEYIVLIAVLVIGAIGLWTMFRGSVQKALEKEGKDIEGVANSNK